MHKGKTFWLLLVITIFAGCTLSVLAPRAAWAHAVLLSSEPAVNSTVSGPDVAVLLRYNSRVDMKHSTLTLLGPDGRTDKVVILSEPAPGLLSAKLTGLTKGVYVLRWQVLATDGHITRGKVPFQVK
jgi:copper resistance protein C